MRILVAVALSLLLAAGAAAAVPNLSDAAAKKGISINWNKRVDYLVIGEHVVVKDIPAQPCKSENISLDQFEFLLGAEKTGYAQISYWKEFRDYSQGKTFSREEMLKLAADGIVGKFTVLPTKKAEAVKVSMSVTGRTGCLGFKTGTYTIHQIQGNEAQNKKTPFRIVSLTYRVDLQPVVREIQEANNIKRDPERKARVLIQYDASRKNWNIVVFDTTNANADFTTDNVASYLAKQE